MTTTLRTAPYLLGLLLTLLAGATQAACTDPTGAEGDVLYHGELAALQYCDDTNWIAVNGTVQLNSGLVGHWAFSEGTGSTAEDSTSNSNDATIEATGVTWTTGRLGNALYFDGVGDGVTIPYDPLFNLETVTLAAWIYPTADGQSGSSRIVSRQRTSATDIYALSQHDDNEIRWRIRTDSSETLYSGSPVPLNQWTHVVGTFDGDAMRIYYDGVEIAYRDVDGSILDTNTAPITIGVHRPPVDPDNDTRRFEGKIDDARVYTRALSDAEIQALSDLGAPGLDLDADLVGHWPLDDGTGSSAAVDISGNGNNGTLDSMDPATDWVAGKYGTALDFDGGNDHVYVLDDTALNPADWSISSWFYINQVTADGEQTIVKKRLDGNNMDYGIAFDQPEESIKCAYENGGTTVSVAGVANGVSVGAWHHTTCVYDSGADTLSLYLDGVSVADPVSGGGTSPPDTVEDLVFGRRASHTNADNLDGQIDDVRIYDRALTAQEVRAVYKQAKLCANPSGVEGDILFNGDEDVLQWCNGNRWVAAGPNPGSAGDAGCANPTGAEGDLIYNGDYKTAQYCDGTLWQRMGDPCDAAAPAPGTVCEDGTVYAGLSPDGNVPMYVTRCDTGQTWDGWTCTGTRSSLPWNDGNDPATSNVSVATNNTDGDGNTATLIGTDSDSVTVGVQPHQAAQACADLSVHGRSDWYLPARNELLDVIYENLVDAIPDDGNPDPIISGFDTAADYYSSSEAIPDTDARWVRFSTGQQFGNSKANAKVFRCARHD